MLDQIPLQLDRKGIKESEDGMRGGEGGDYSREVIIVNISIKGVKIYYSREAITWGTAIYSRKYNTLN